jgi:hypothetical protein
MTPRRIAARLYPWLLGLGPVAVAAFISIAAPACSSKTSGSLGGDDSDDGSASSSSSSSGGSSSSGSSSGATSSSSSSGGHASSGSSSSGASETRVPSQVTFNDAGLVLCGSTGCDLTTHICCLNEALKTACIPNTSTCQSGYASFACAEKSDCPSGKVCCAMADESSATAGMACQDVASQGGQCLPAPSATANQASAQACQTTAECVNGMTCSWQDCSISGTSGIIPAPQLTLCGPQSEAPFNCVPHQ